MLFARAVTENKHIYLQNSFDLGNPFHPLIFSPSPQSNSEVVTTVWTFLEWAHKIKSGKYPLASLSFTLSSLSFPLLFFFLFSLLPFPFLSSSFLFFLSPSLLLSYPPFNFSLLHFLCPSLVFSPPSLSRTSFLLLSFYVSPFLEEDQEFNHLLIC